MTIKEFAGLVNCNPQTLRYYDSVGLLKPYSVDKFSGYRQHAFRHNDRKEQVEKEAE